MAADDNKNEVFITRTLLREQSLIARSDKSVAYVTNNKRLRSTFCTIKANYTDRHEASHGLFATAGLLVTYGSRDYQADQ